MDIGEELLVVPAEDLGLVPSTHMAAQPSETPVAEDLIPSDDTRPVMTPGMCLVHRHTWNKILIHIK